MDLRTATAAYEAWLAGFGPLFPSDLAHKREAMADPDDPFPFFRGTYYRWPHHWRAHAGDALAAAPRVLAVGDLHVENFGIWRDRDGRLCWGVNDFDEADELPCASDLVRLAASVRLARADGGLDVSMKAACAAILAGYREGVGGKGDPFVLEERHHELRALAYDGDPPDKFWRKLGKAFEKDWPADVPPLPKKARAALTEDLPAARPEYRPRLETGMGSLGKPRYMARVQAAGGWLAREAKRVTPPATAWDAGSDAPSRMAAVVAAAVRNPDPFYRPGPEWVTRRLGPKAMRIELGQLVSADDLDTVLHAMGAETANVHLGTPGAAKDIRRHLDALPADWLRGAAKVLADAVEGDWKEWRG